MDEQRAAELCFRAVRDTLLEHGADVSSHPFDKLAHPDRALWLAVWRRLRSDLEIEQLEEALRRSKASAKRRWLRKNP